MLSAAVVPARPGERVPQDGHAAAAGHAAHRLVRCLPGMCVLPSHNILSKLGAQAQRIVRRMICSE